MSASTICAAPFFFYRCATNGFTGCCTKDPCSLSWCPDFAEPADKPFMSLMPETLTTSKQSDLTDSQGVTTSSFTQNAQATFNGDSSTFRSASTSDSMPTTDASPSTFSLVSTSDDIIIVFTTSEVYVSSQAVTHDSHASVLSPITEALMSTTLSSISVTTRTHTHIPTTTVTIAPQSRVTVTATAKPHTSYAKRHEAQIIAGTMGSVAGILIAVGLIWLFVYWNRQRTVAAMREGQIDDDPSMAGRDANRAGEYFHKDEGQTAKRT